MKCNKNIKAFSFDLNTKALEKHYPNGYWHNAYYDIKNFFDRNNIKHIQGSTYLTTYPISDNAASKILKVMRKNYPWVNHCVNSFIITDVPKSYDVTHSFKKESHRLLMTEMKEKILKEIARGKSFSRIEKTIKVNSKFDRKTLAMLNKIKQHKDIKAIIAKENEYSR